MYICCEVGVWAKFGLLKGYYVGQVGLVSGPRSFLVYFYSGFKRLLHIQLSFHVYFLPCYQAIL